MTKQSVKLQPPLGGLNRAADFQSQPPYTTPDCRNARPFTRTGRQRIGSRAGTRQFLYASAAAGAINMLSTVEYVQSTFARYVEDFADGIRTPENWATSVAGLVAPSIDRIEKAYYYDYSAASPRAGFVHSTLSQDAAATMYVFLTVVPMRTEHAATYRVYFLLNDATPDPSDTCIQVTMTYTTSGGSDTVVYSIDKINGGVATNIGNGTYSSLGKFDAHTFRVAYDPTGNTVKIVSDQAAEIASGSVTAPVTRVGTRVGWSMQPLGPGKRASVSYVAVQYLLASTSVRDTTLYRTLAGGGGKIYSESFGRGLAEVSASWSLTTDGPVMVAQRNQTGYIADYGDVVFSDTNANVGNYDPGAPGPPYNWQFETNPEVNLIADYNINANDYVIEIVSYSNSADEAVVPLGCYSFTIVTVGGTGTNDSVRLYRTSSTAPVSATASIRIRRVPKQFDPSTLTLSQLLPGLIATETNYGSTPLGCKIICEYRDRLVFCGDYAYYMSRVAVPYDFNYGVDSFDPRKAVSGTLSEAGSPARKITAAVALSDQYLIISARDRIYRMVGDIANNGTFGPVSDNVGIIGPFAWCVTPDGWLYFLSDSGIYRMSANAQSRPEPVSRQVLPDELQNIDGNVYNVSLVYDDERQGVHIFVSGIREKQGQFHWWYDLRGGGFWQDNYPSTYEPMVATKSKGYYYSLSPVLMGCRDGYIRSIDERYRTDAATAIDSYVVYGPIRGSDAIDEDSSVDGVSVLMGEDATDSTFVMYSGKTPEQAFTNTINDEQEFSKTVGPGLNQGIRPRRRGNAFCVGIRSDSGSHWSVGEMQLTGEVVGGSR